MHSLYIIKTIQVESMIYQKLILFIVDVMIFNPCNLVVIDLFLEELILYPYSFSSKSRKVK